jgi:hypothetical protein
LPRCGLVFPLLGNAMVQLRYNAELPHKKRRNPAMTT